MWCRIWTGGGSILFASVCCERSDRRLRKGSRIPARVLWMVTMEFVGWNLAKGGRRKHSRPSAWIGGGTIS